MRVTFLGTGTSQGVPVIACDCEVCQSNNPKDNRLRSSILIEWKETTLIVDTGPDFRQQLLRTTVQKLDAVLYTHEHKDHTAGLDDVRAFNYKFNRPMPLYAEQRVLDSLKNEFRYIFSDYPGVPKIELNKIHNKAFFIGNKKIIPIRVLHKNLPILGYRFDDFAYITDASFIMDSELEKLKGVHTLVLNAVRIKEHHSHFNLESALKIFAKIRPEKSYITHIGHQLGRHNTVSKKLPETIELAYDGLVLDFNK